MAKEKKYRTKEERIANCEALKKGNNIELFRNVADTNPAELGLGEHYDPISLTELRDMTVGELMDRLNLRAIYFKQAGQSECMRDISDVEAVMNENNIVGTVQAFRFVDQVQRKMQQVCGFVRPKNEAGEDGEEHGPASTQAEEPELPEL